VTSDDVLAFHDRLTVCVDAGVPVPVTVSVVVLGCALLVNVSVALTAPATCGLKVTVNGVVWPAGMVTGSASPLTLNTELFELTAVTVTFAPVAIRLPEAVPLLPATTLPRFRVVGLTVNCPVAAVPVPDNVIVKVGLDAVEVMVTVPLALCPAPNVNGVLIPLRLKPVPEIVA
jgi:hypothetical protein